MQQVATCPACDARLSLPTPTIRTDGSMLAECPLCSDRFALTIDRLTFLPIARLKPAGEAVAAEEVVVNEEESAQLPDEPESVTEQTLSAPGDGESTLFMPELDTRLSEDPPTIQSSPAETLPEPARAETSGTEPMLSSPEPIKETNEEAEGEQRATLPTLADLLERRSAAAQEASTDLGALASFLPKSTPDEVAEETAPAEEPTGATAERPIATDAAEQDDDDFSMTPAAQANEPASEPLSQDFSFDLNAATRSSEQPATDEAATPRANDLPARSPGGGALRRTAFVTGGGLSGLALGFYLLSLFGGDGLAFVARNAERDAVTEPAVEPDLLNEETTATSRPLALAQPEPGGARQASFNAPVDLTAVAPAPSGRHSNMLWSWLPDAPRFDVDSLTATLAHADSAAETLKHHRLTDAEGLQQVGLGYAKLCELAQVVSLLEPDNSHPDMMMRRLEAEDVYRKLFRSEHVRSDSRQIAARWIAWQGRPHGGVFFSGLPTGPPRKAGDGLYKLTFDVGDGVEVEVVTPQVFKQRRFKKADEMMIIGCVIDSPRGRLRGYDGDAERVVWRATSIALKDADLP